MEKLIFIRNLIIALALITLPQMGYSEDNGKEKLENFFTNLAQAETPERANEIIEDIWVFWTHDNEDATNLSMINQGIVLTQQGQFQFAERIFSRIIERDESFMEAWNKRATVRYMMGKLDESTSDIEEVLKREPRHFGALSGLAAIRLHQGDFQSALNIYQHILEIHPFSVDALTRIPELQKKLKGKPV